MLICEGANTKNKKINFKKGKESLQLSEIVNT